MNHRLEKLRGQFDLLGINAFFVTFLPHLRYVSGFSGSNGIGIVTPTAAVLITDGRYAQQVKSEVTGWKVLITQGSLLEKILRRSLLPPRSRVGFDGNAVPYSQFISLKKSFPKVKFLPKAEVIEKIAAVKDAGEIASIGKAVSITDKTFHDILQLMKPGVSELDIAAEISYLQRKYGAEADAFETIVASGERGALPHGRASAKLLKNGELVTLDFGCVFEGYHSDMTRTIALGRAKPEARKIYQIVLDAQCKAIDHARDGVKTKDLDAVARGYIRKHGYDKYYRHSLGHGIGLQIHEAPRISVLSSAVLEKGNVVTIEPGIYLPEFGGVRIEDDVVIENGSCRVLNRSPKELMVL